MKKLILFVVFAAIGFITVKIVQKIRTKSLTEENIKKMPDISFKGLDNESYRVRYLNPEKAAVLIYFNTGCDHCNYEVQEIKTNIERLSNTSIVLISSEPIDTLQRFSANHSLEVYDNIKILKDTADTFYKAFATRMIPTVLVYNENRELLRKFSGETKIDAIINSINE